MVLRDEAFQDLYTCIPLEITIHVWPSIWAKHDGFFLCFYSLSLLILLFLLITLPPFFLISSWDKQEGVLHLLLEYAEMDLDTVIRSRSHGRMAAAVYFWNEMLQIVKVHVHCRVRERGEVE